MDENVSEKDEGRAPRRVKCLEKNEIGQLAAVLDPGDERVEDVKLARCFPWSLPDAYISVLNATGNEICMLSTLDDLDDDSREIAEVELREKVFNPKIERILDCKHEFGISIITAKTDRGEVIFQIRGRNDVRFLTPTRALFRDVDGNTYELTDYDQLDPQSKRRLERYF